MESVFSLDKTVQITTFIMDSLFNLSSQSG